MNWSTWRPILIWRQTRSTTNWPGPLWVSISSRSGLALARLKLDSDAHSLGRFLAIHDTERLADWFEHSAPLCYEEPSDPKQVLSAVLELETESADGETLAGALVRLAAKMRRLGYSIPKAD